MDNIKYAINNIHKDIGFVSALHKQQKSWKDFFDACGMWSGGGKREEGKGEEVEQRRGGGNEGAGVKKF